MSRQHILISDVDSTITNHWLRIRRYTLPSWPGDSIGRPAFTRDAVLTDAMLDGCDLILKDLVQHGWRIRYLTARGWPDAYKITVEQLSNFGLPSPNDVTIVNNMKEKVAALKMGCDVYVDDFMTGQERAIGTFHKDVATAIEAMGIRVIVFRNDWFDVLEQVERWMERQKS